MSNYAYATELMYCNGLLASVASARRCTIPLNRFVTTPFNLIEGDHIYAKVIANNLHGQSEYSLEGNGASIWLVPDAPLSLSNNAALTDATQIALTWTPGVSNRGTEVIDYRIYYTSESINAFVELNAGILDEYYTTTATLLPGQNYKFKV